LRFALLSSKVFTLALFYFIFCCIFSARFSAKVLKFALRVPAGLKLENRKGVRGSGGLTHTNSLIEIEKLFLAFATTRKIAHTPR